MVANVPAVGFVGELPSTSSPHGKNKLKIEKLPHLRHQPQ
jgi:hypothetical protein